MFYEKLKEFRNSLGMTQQQFAEATGIARSIIAQLENGIRPPSKNVLLKLAKYSDKGLDWWYGREDKEKNWGELNSLNVLLDYMIEKGLINQDGDMDEQSKDYIWKMIESEIQKKLKEKAL